MRTGTRFTLIAATAVSLTAALALPAQAAPIASPRITGPLFADCSGLGPVEIVNPPANGQAQFTPGFVVGTHAVAVPYSFDFVFSIDGVPQETQFTAKTAVPKDAQVCQLVLGYGEDGGHTYSFTGTVVIAVHGQPLN